jgi:hypothetical protein
MSNTNRPLPALTDGTEPAAPAGGACACCSVPFASLNYPKFVRQAEWVCVGCAESIDEQSKES